MKVSELIELLQRQDPDAEAGVGFGDEIVSVLEVDVWNGTRRHVIIEPAWMEWEHSTAVDIRKAAA